MQISKKLVVKKEIPIADSLELINSLDIAMADIYCREKNYEKGLDIYKKLLAQPNNPNYDNVLNRYIDNSLLHANELTLNKKYLEALEIYRELITVPRIPISVYKNIGLCTKLLGNADVAIKFLKKFEEISPDKEDVYIYLADITYADIKDNRKAIEYYEKALEKNASNPLLYNMLGHLYSKCYQDRFKEKQIDYLTKAYQLLPNNRTIVKNLAYVYGKFDEIQKADEFYAKLMYLNPTHSDLHSYGAYLVKHKHFSEGFKFLQHRFQKEDLTTNSFPPLVLTKKKRWNMKTDIKNKHILVHFEQGYGDSIMFVRFLDELKEKCAKVSLAVQNTLIPLFKDSDLGVDIYTEKEAKTLEYDYFIPMMDLPIVCETAYNTIPKTSGYLKVSKEKIKEYKNKFINNNDKFKIGIAYEGSMESKETERDIELKYFYPLMQMDQVEVYSFQVSDVERQMEKVPRDYNLIRLGGTFKTWEDTACAVMNMDLMITTDNGVLNLCGALGAKTFGLFNTISEWRWFDTEGKNVGWYKSVRPFKAPASKEWDVPINEIMQEIETLRCKKIVKKIKQKS